MDKTSNSACPYVGLQPFTENDREFFFGRDRERRIIASNLRAAPLTILYGASGVGKSSVLLAGVVPRLRASPRTVVVVFRAWQDVTFLQALKQEIQTEVERVLGKPVKLDHSLPLDDFLYEAARALGDSILILIDQFEEYFLYHPESRDNPFDAEFARAVNREDVDVAFLIAMREDSLSKLDRFRARIPNLLGNTLRLQPLDARAAEEAIRKPLDVYNQRHLDAPATIEDELVTAIIAQVRTGAMMIGQTGRGRDSQKSDSGKAEIETPFLQLVLTRLWEEETNPAYLQPSSSLGMLHPERKEIKGKVRLRASTLERLGGAERIVRTHLDQLMVRLTEREQDVCALFFDRMVTPTGTKIAQAQDDLIAYAQCPAEQVKAILKTLSDARVVRPISPPPDQPTMIRYEIFHDVLAPAILDWRRRYVEKQEVERLRREERERRARLIRRVAMTAGAILLFIFAGLTLIAIRQTLLAQAAETEAIVQRDAAVQARATSEALRQIVRARQLAFTAIGDLAVDPERSILIALNSVSVAETMEGEQALHNALIGSRVRLRLDKHTAEVWGAQFSADDKLAVTASRDKTARVWDVATGNSLLTLNHPTEVHNASFSPDGKRVVTASADGLARVWDVSAAPASPAPMILRGHTGALWVAVFSPDGKQILTASSDQTARVWDATTGRTLALFTLASEVRGAAFSPDGKLIVTASSDNMARVWNAATGSVMAELVGHTKPVLDANFSPDGKRIVTAGDDAAAIVWDGSGKKLLELREHADSVFRAAFSPDGKKIITASADQTVRIWNADTGKVTDVLSGHKHEVRSAVYSGDSRLILTASGDKSARVWDAVAGVELIALSGHSDIVWNAQYSPDNTRLATASFDQTARVWDVSTSLNAGAATGRELLALRGHAGRVWSASFSPDGKRIVTGSSDRTARVWDTVTGVELLTLSGHTGTVYSAAFSPDGKRIVTASLDKTARVWDASTGIPTAILVGHTDSVRSAEFSPDGKRIVTASFDQTARVWDAQSGQELAVLKGHTGLVVRAVFSPDGNRIATASNDTFARIWDAASGQPLLILRGHTNSVFGVDYSPDGKRIVTASADRTARVWDAATGEELINLTGHTATVNNVMYSPDGKQIVTASDDGTARVYLTRPPDLIALAKTRVTRELECEERQKYLREDVNCPATTPTPRP